MTANTSTTAAATAVTSSVISKSLGEHLDRVLRGEEFVIFRNDRETAALVDVSTWQARTAPGNGLTATMRSYEDKMPINRTAYAAHVRAVADQEGTGDEPVTVRRGTVEAAALMLDELAGTYAGEDFGRLARELAVRLFDAAGV